MIAWLIARFGERAAQRVVLVVAILLFVVTVLVLTRCDRRKDEAREQAAQTSRSGEAVADAAQAAIVTIGERVATEKTIDQATAQAVKGVENAQDADAVRAAVLDGVCRQVAHRNDPACKVR